MTLSQRRKLTKEIKDYLKEQKIKFKVIAETGNILILEARSKYHYQHMLIYGVPNEWYNKLKHFEFRNVKCRCFSQAKLEIKRYMDGLVRGAPFPRLSEHKLSCGWCGHNQDPEEVQKLIKDKSRVNWSCSGCGRSLNIFKGKSGFLSAYQSDKARYERNVEKGVNRI